MGAWEALRRTLSTIYGRQVTDDDASIIKIYPKGSAPSTGDNIFPVYAFTPNSCPPGYEYYTDTNGVIAVKCLHDTSGATTVTEASAATIMSYTQAAARAVVNQSPSINTQDAGLEGGATQLQRNHRIGVKVITLDGAGAASDQELVPQLASYYGVLQIDNVITNFTDAATLLNFQDEDNTELLGQITGGFSLNVTTNTMNTQISGTILTQATYTDQKALEVDISGGGAAGKVIIYYTYWYET